MSDSEDEAPDKQLKIVIMGDGASGKVRKNKNVGQYPTKNGLSLCHELSMLRIDRSTQGLSLFLLY